MPPKPKPPKPQPPKPPAPPPRPEPAPMPQAKTAVEDDGAFAQAVIDLYAKLREGAPRFSVADLIVLPDEAEYEKSRKERDEQ
jgi:hypothetical protein